MLSFLRLYVLEDVAVRQSLLTDWLVTVSPSRTNRLSQRVFGESAIKLDSFRPEQAALPLSPPTHSGVDYH